MNQIARHLIDVVGAASEHIEALAAKPARKAMLAINDWTCGRLSIEQARGIKGVMGDGLIDAVREEKALADCHAQRRPSDSPGSAATSRRASTVHLAVAIELDARLDVGPGGRPLACGARRRCRGRPGGRPPRRGGAALAVRAVGGVAVELDAPRRGGAALARARRRGRGRRAGRAPRRGGAALTVRAVDVAAGELDARLDAAALACGARR